MNKKTEIDTLMKLSNEDTYFAQFFGKYLSGMINNINNDFGIETNLRGGDMMLMEMNINQLHLLKTIGSECISLYVGKLEADINGSYFKFPSLVKQLNDLKKLLETISKL